jgi:hypothetical protein
MTHETRGNQFGIVAHHDDAADLMMREAASWDREEVLRRVAYGKVDALHSAARHLALRALLGRITMEAAAAILHEASLNNRLYSDFGVDFIRALLADAYDDATVTAGSFAVGRKDSAA